MDRDLSQSFTSSNAHFNPGDADFSLGGWFKVEEITNTMNLMSQGASGDRSWTLILISGGVIRWSPTNSAGSYDTDFEPSGNTDVDPNEWFHVAVTHTASTNNHRVYLNGQFVGDVTQQLRAATTPIFDLGAQFGNVQNFLSGSIQDTFFQNGSVLSDSEINAIYSRRFKGSQVAGGHVLGAASMPQNLPSTNISFFNLNADGSDDSGNARNLTNNGAIPFSGLNIFGQVGAAQADGSTQYFSSSDAFFNPDNEAFATGGWFAIDDPTSPNFLITQNFSNSDRGWRILYDGVGNLSFSVTNDATPAAFAVIQEFQLTDLPIRNGSWHHIAMSYDGDGNLTYYLDGQAIGSNVISDVRAPTGGNTFNVMSTDNGGSFAKGRVQDVFFIRDIVRDADIAKLASRRLDHSAAISVLENQQWYGQFFRSDNGDVQNEFDQGFILDKKENSLYIDLDLDSGDQVALRLQNQGLSTTVVPIKTFTTGKVTSSPSFPLSHSLGCRPKDFYVLTEGQTLSGDDDKRFDLCSADDSIITCDLSSLTIDASHPVEVVASCAPIAVAIDIATDAQMLIQQNKSSGDVFVGSGQSYYKPNVEVQSGHTYTIDGTWNTVGAVIGSGSIAGSGALKSLDNGQNGEPAFFPGDVVIEGTLSGGSPVNIEDAVMGDDAASAVGSSENPTLRFGSSNYRLGFYTDDEAGHIKNKNGDDGICIDTKNRDGALIIDDDFTITYDTKGRDPITGLDSFVTYYRKFSGTIGASAVNLNHQNCNAFMDTIAIQSSQPDEFIFRVRMYRDAGSLLHYKADCLTSGAFSCSQSGGSGNEIVTVNMPAGISYTFTYGTGTPSLTVSRVSGSGSGAVALKTECGL